MVSPYRTTDFKCNVHVSVYFFNGCKNVTLYLNCNEFDKCLLGIILFKNARIFMWLELNKMLVNILSVFRNNVPT